jgi:uroporphyrin-III C-methyltransferase
VNAADDPELCSFHLPARLERGTLQVAIASAGEAPFVVRRLRRLLEQRFGPEWSGWIEAAGRFRKALRELNLPVAEMEKRYDAFFAGTVDAASWSARTPAQEELEAWLGGRAHEPQRARGFVSLVGAGPGDPGLLTLRARQRLMAADAVVYDRLAESALPCDLPPRVELHDVGKQADDHPVPQEQINALLVRLAQRGLRVVRFKGGDPFVFGRGGEEAEELARAGIPFEVVPGVTAGVAVPAYAGIPATHRGEAVRLNLLTAHESQKTGGPQMRWDLLAADPHATLVGYMGVRQLGEIVAELVAAGMDPETPAAMVERGTTCEQRVVRESLAALPEAVRAAGLRPPGLFVIGPTVRHAQTLDWYAARPLFGQRLLLPAPAGALRDELELAGAELVELPLPVTPAARVVMGSRPLTGCVLGCARQVDALDAERAGASWPEDMVAWCTSEEAAERARALGWPRVELVDADKGSQTLIATLLERST